MRVRRSSWFRHDLQAIIISNEEVHTPALPVVTTFI